MTFSGAPAPDAAQARPTSASASASRYLELLELVEAACERGDLTEATHLNQEARLLARTQAGVRP